MNDSSRIEHALSMELPGFAVGERKAIFNAMTPLAQLTAEKGQLVYHYKQPFHTAYLLLDGLVRSYSYAGTQEVNLRFLAAPALVVPFYSLAEYMGLQQQPAVCLSSESIECVQRCQFISWPVSKLITHDAAQLDSALFYKLQAYMAAQHYLSMQQRLLMMQHKKAVDRYQFFCSVMPPAVVDGMPDFQVASYLGLTPETLSRVKPK